MVVEDDPLMGLLMADVLSDAGAEVVGPFATVTDATAAADGVALDGAVLDVQLLDGASYPVASHLEARSIPYAFLSSSDPAATPKDLHPVDFLPKPARRAEVIGLCQRVLAARA
jgi:DNA-binding response OmpR family regulator